MKQTWKSVLRLSVELDFGEGIKTIPVGTLAKSNEGQDIYFEAAQESRMGIREISPLIKLLSRGASHPVKVEARHVHLFQGLFGVFGDSLPDGWGMLLMDRWFAGMGYRGTSGLDRLAWIGTAGMGALTYKPAPNDTSAESISINELAAAAESFQQEDAAVVLNALYKAGGSPGGARPKAVVHLDGPPNSKGVLALVGTQVAPAGFTPWLVKFRGPSDTDEDILVEHVYLKTAKAAGIEVPESCIVSAGKKQCLATRRFDRTENGGRLHYHSLAGLLHADFRQPLLEYDDFLNATRLATRSEPEVLKAYALACFNLAVHNRDDHAKNFGFLMDAQGAWRLAPAFDLTFAMGPRGEHTTMYAGEGRSPTPQHLVEVAKRAGIDLRAAKQIQDKVTEAVLGLAASLKLEGVSPKHPSLKHAKEQLKKSASVLS